MKNKENRLIKFTQLLVKVEFAYFLAGNPSIHTSSIST